MDGLYSINENISAEETISMIDAAIAKQQDAPEESLLAMKFQRNGLLPISRLPPEIVCYIFTLGQITDLVSGFKKRRLRWIQFTHVCRRWRDTALDSPSLWVHLPIGQLRWVEEMLERSKGSSLIVEDFIPTSFADSGLELALKHFWRTKTLALAINNRTTWTALQEVLSESALRLEYLSLEGLWNQEDPDNNRPLSLSKDVLRQTERLRKFELINLEIDWSVHHHLLRSLLHLTLCIGPFSGTCPLTEKQLVDALKEMPDLEFLELNGALRVQNDQHTSWASENIQLARLRTLRLSSDIAEVEAFFRYVSFPPTANVQVSCRESRTSAGTIDPYFSGVILGLSRSYSKAPSDIVFRTLSVDRANLRLVEVRLFTEDLAEDVPDVIPNMNTIPIALVQLWFTFSHDRGSLAVQAKLITDILNGPMPLNDLRQIRLRGISADIFRNNDAVANALGALPHLRTIVV